MFVLMLVVVCMGLVGRCGRFFFFQAEDGIRDIGVTGVQTCALPIWGPFAPTAATVPAVAALRSPRGDRGARSRTRRASYLRACPTGLTPSPRDSGRVRQIGRASCRERVEIGERVVAGKERGERRGQV